MQYFIELLNSLERGVVAPVYLFYGEETYLREQAVARFKDYFVQGGESALNYDLVDGEAVNPVDIAARAETLPFFSDKRLVVVRNPLFFKARRAGEPVAETGEETKVPEKEQTLLNYLENPLTSTCLVFTTGEPVDKRKKIFRLIKKNGRAIDFNFLKKAELGRWLAQKAGAAGKKFETGAGDAFLESVGPSLQNLVMELDKLINYTAGREVITLTDVRRVSTPGVDDNIFAIVDAIGGKRCGEALAGIKELLAAKEPPLRLLAMITRQFRLLLQVSDLTGRGCPAREIYGRLKIQPFVYKKIATQCRNFEQNLLIGVFESLSELESAVKTGRQEFYPAIETYLLKLCL
ncbi:DNA polymerase III subunit delta [Pelotomaculum terephthalicicum JT]|uniref:DNA polymerase III subunit delta n=1 Tax=Pelotomaculum TaxID=191373 RepID=UPI0009CC156D|nr:MULTISPECIES: DNA polymerase III subunit delta [Pelotomaculum]MCG9967025.1 DNA polymerase III subunit delta [Pelotomaculum terephthalicicum JT]OPX90529.1 MAG: DNA polymerase III subunit delta [Pelotomaculum sp. PtaB.Bin117]OPY60065.1 MAG: DNA polymerase III subunit delta [Pelotomaculum sp. PtaU1.Bin065]